MDDLDRRLVSLLRRNARENVADLAAALGVSRGTVANRMRRLEGDRVVLGYTIRLRGGAEPEEIRAWMGIEVEGTQTRQVVAGLLGEAGVGALHDTNGRWDLLAELRAPSMAELARTLDRIRLIRGIRATETSIHLSTFR